MNMRAPSKEFMAEPGTILHSFFIGPYQCFRLLKSESPQAAHCPEPVVWRGPWRDVTGELWIVEACERHRPLSDLERPLEDTKPADR